MLTVLGQEDIFDDKPGENWVGSPAMKRIHERLKMEKNLWRLGSMCEASVNRQN